MIMVDMSYEIRKARSRKAERRERGIIADQAELKARYQRIGFIGERRATFPHLPFSVLLISMPLQQTVNRQTEASEHIYFTWIDSSGMNDVSLQTGE